MIDKIFILDGSERFHIDNTLDVLSEIGRSYCPSCSEDIMRYGK